MICLAFHHPQTLKVRMVLSSGLKTLPHHHQVLSTIVIKVFGMALGCCQVCFSWITWYQPPSWYAHQLPLPHFSLFNKASCRPFKERLPPFPLQPIGNGLFYLFEELSQPRLYISSVVILERGVRSLKVIVGGGKTILKALKPIPKVRIYPNFLDILNYPVQLWRTTIVGFEEGPHIFELHLTSDKLHNKEVSAKYIHVIHVGHPQ